MSMLGQNFVGGAVKPTEIVQEYTQGELAPLLAGQQGAKPGLRGTSQLTATGPKFTVQPRSFEAVNTLVDSGHSASMARIQQRNKLQALASQQAGQMQTVKGLGGVPYQYGQGRQTYVPKAQGSYAQQQASGQGLGGRYGIRPDASQSFGQMEAAFSQVFGGGIPVVDGFRSYENQVKAWQAMQNGGPRAAPPGTSLHGAGIAVDLGGPFQNSGSAQHRWLQQNGSRFGWYWVGRDYGEPWHWEYHPG